MQDAIRYSRLKKLPPVLHFSVVRFCYDFNSDIRKKSKHPLSFPKDLDMSPFLTGEASVEHAVYELRGILRHIGPSAYRGHYEAQVLDPTLVQLFSSI